jgi:hypothetical protein
MPWAAAVVGGALISSQGAKDAAGEQADATRDAADANSRQFERNVELQKPWRDAGMGALSQMTAGIGAGGEFSQGFQFNPASDPSYQWRLQQGLAGVNSNAAASGLLQSGGTLKALMNYGQGAASQEYGAQYNRWNNDVTNRFNRLASVAGVGQTATRDVAQMGTQMAGANGELMLQGANARAAGQVGTANAIGSGLSQLGNWWQSQGSNSYAPNSGGMGYSGGSAMNQGSSGGDAGGSYWGIE